ncbi:MAG: aminotransferase class I/II-fold pyridoxal phosphate-dependent enzyme, partial [Proteobacteria bacterium]|nr:aminotransferase class I/II-fold pyridoxal phosphate-dependent enzyme [Pseudomonadota bacterium]
MKFSSFGNFLTSGSGILTLMEDIDSALNSSAEMRPLGGGNPARIPEMQRVFRDAMNKLLADGEEFERLAGKYDGARGNARFIDGLATLLQSRCGWDVGPQNIAITNGSQSSFYVLFHLFAGEFKQGKKRKILLPLAPEYIGYADVGMGADLFHTYRPTIELRGDREFKYHVDFAHLDVSDEIGAIAVSRPTNPTGNVLTDAEVAHLRELAIRHEVPFILDSAYGGPFPNIVFPETENLWDNN